MAFDEAFHPKFKSDLKKIDKNNTQYRIAYEIQEDEKVIFHYMVATRENFYKKLEKRTQ